MLLNWKDIWFSLFRLFFCANLNIFLTLSLVCCWLFANSRCNLLNLLNYLSDYSWWLLKLLIKNLQCLN